MILFKIIGWFIGWFIIIHHYAKSQAMNRIARYEKKQAVKRRKKRNQK